MNLSNGIKKEKENDVIDHTNWKRMKNLQENM